MADKKSTPPRKPVRMSFGVSWIYIGLLVLMGWMMFNQGGGKAQKEEWPDVEKQWLAGDIKEIVFIKNTYDGKVTIRPEKLDKYADKFGGQVPKRSPHFYFSVTPSFDAEKTFKELNAQLPDGESVVYKVETERDIWSILEWVLFPVLLILMWVFMFRGFNRNSGGSGGGPGGIFNVGKSTGRLAEKDSIKVTFKDVAGLYGAKDEVMEIVDFLKNPSKYTALGGKIPKGALLVGPPGTGKTLLAKAVAGEANVPFFSISGSDFVEMFVGVGASRVRDLFRQAKEKSPCIVFIDEIDAVGRARGRNVGYSSNDERENTLNQLLTEMDGFGTNSGVIILAATNRADILDKALMRAGRFDRQIHVDLPELQERREILEVHLKKIKLAEDFDVDYIAKHTPGFSGADLANICNEAALTAARKNKEYVEKQDFLDAIDRVIGGLERKTTMMTEEEKRATAYHEAGHAVVSWLLPKANPVFKVTIVPRGQSLGATWYLPDERYVTTKEQMIEEMCATIGGRVADELHSGQPCTGALSDLEKLTKRAYAMVTYYGMNEKVGNVSFYDSTGSRGYDLTKPYSEKTAELIDKEVRELVDMVHEKTRKILTDNFEGFSQLAELLLEKEVIFADDLEKIFGPRAGAKPEEKSSASDEKPAAVPEDQPTAESEEQA